MLTSYAERLHQAFDMTRVPSAHDADEDARADRLSRLAEGRRQQRRELFSLLGCPIYTNTTILPLADGTSIGPARNQRGVELKWTLWSPHRRVLVDIFKPYMPVKDELDARAAFATRHHLRYAIVKPGWRFTLASLKEWLKA